MKPLYRALLLTLVAATAGCAHAINLAPPLNTLEVEGIPKIDKTAGYYIDPALRGKSVTTPGGGGDKVKYTPYADVEPALRNVLERIFASVVTVPSPTDQKAPAPDRPVRVPRRPAPPASVSRGRPESSVSRPRGTRPASPEC